VALFWLKNRFEEATLTAHPLPSTRTHRHLNT
jgi:hypothetical protein